MIRPIAIRPDNSDGNLTSLVSPLSSLSISANYNSSTTQNHIHSHYQRQVNSSPIEHPTPPPPPQPLSATPTLSDVSERRYARMPSISTINSSALNQNNAQQLSSTQQIVPRGGT